MTVALKKKICRGTKPDRRTLSETLRQVSYELHLLFDKDNELIDLRAAGDLAYALANHVDLLPHPSLAGRDLAGNGRAAIVERLVNAIEALTPHQGASRAWWLPAVERARLMDLEASRTASLGTRWPGVQPDAAAE